MDYSVLGSMLESPVYGNPQLCVPHAFARVPGGSICFSTDVLCFKVPHP